MKDDDGGMKDEDGGVKEKGGGRKGASGPVAGTGDCPQRALDSMDLTLVECQRRACVAISPELFVHPQSFS